MQVPVLRRLLHAAVGHQLSKQLPLCSFLEEIMVVMEPLENDILVLRDRVHHHVKEKASLPRFQVALYHLQYASNGV